MIANPSPFISLKAKVVLPLLLVGILVGLFGSWYTYTYITSQLEGKMFDRAQHLANAVLKSLEFLDGPDEYQRYVDRIGEEKDVQFIVAAFGRPIGVIASTKQEWRGMTLDQLPPEAMPDKLQSAAEDEKEHRFFNKTNQAFAMVVPFHSNSDIYTGALMIQLDARPTQQELANIAMSLTATYLFFVLLITAIAYGLLHIFILKPSQNIKQTMERRAQGQTDAFTANVSNDEIGQLAQTLNEMLYSLTEQEQMLRMEIHRRIESEKDLMVAKEQAEQANNAKGEFLANMSHEIRSPLNGVMGMIQLMMRTELTTKQKEFLNIANASSKTLLTVINDILDFSKIEAGKLTIEKIPFDLQQVVEEVVEMGGGLIQGKDVDLILNYDPEASRYFVSDPVRIRQILTNLVSNAVKFTDNGEINVAIRRIEDHDSEELLLMEVSDTGIGIPDEKLQEIFNKFTQADTSSTRKYGGTGLGLSITEQLVRLLDGDIGVRSEMGKGTTFWVHLCLPKHDGVLETQPTAQEISADLARVAQIERKAPTYSVLVAEDNRANQIVALNMLEEMGCKVDIASSGKEAVAKALEKPYDMIFMDCQMPEMDGYEATGAIRKAGNKTTVIAMTAHALQGARERCLEAGMDDYVSKPISMEQLQAMLEKWAPQRPDTGQNGHAGPNNQEGAQTVNDAKDVVDMENLLNRVRGNKSLLKNLLGLFLEECPLTLAKIKDAVAQQNADALKRSAHELKGMCLNYSAVEMQNLAKQLEKLGEAENLAEAPVLCQLLESAYPQVEAFFQDWMATN